LPKPGSRRRFAAVLASIWGISDYTTLIGDEAVKLIDQQDGKQSFFLCFARAARAVELYRPL
jgi:hypothetical protein